MNPHVGAALAQQPPRRSMGPLPGNGSTAGRGVVTPNPQNVGGDIGGGGSAYTMGTPVAFDAFGPSGVRHP